jgi:hypothetical protein
MQLHLSLYLIFTLPHMFSLEDSFRSSVMLRCVDCYTLSYQRFKATRLLDPEDEGMALLQNVGNTTRHNVPEDFHLQQHCCKSVKSRTF